MTTATTPRETKSKKTTHSAKVTDIRYLGLYQGKYLYKVELNARGCAFCWSEEKVEPVEVGQYYHFDLYHNLGKGTYTMKVKYRLNIPTPYPPRRS